MFDLSNKIIFVSLVVTLLCSVVVYYSMRQRINQTEQNMDTMFNLVSSLNDEQKRLGNLVVYSINQQEASATAKLVPFQGGNSVDENRNAMEDGGQSSLIMQEIEHSNLINLNDATEDDIEDEQPSNMINLLLQGQADLRVVVSDDEGVDEDESEDEEEDDSNENAELKSIAIEESSDDEDERTVELNKLKVNELKQLLDTLDITKGEIAKAKKLKKNELVEFIKQVMVKAEAQEDEIDGEDDDNADEQTVVENENTNKEADENDGGEEDEDDDDVLEQVANLEDDSELDDNDSEPNTQSHELPTAVDEPVVELNDDDFNNDDFNK